MAVYTTSPYAAKVYVYVATDAIAHVSSADAGGSFPLANIIDANHGPNLSLPGRTTTAAIGDGFIITLATETTVGPVAVVNIKDQDPGGSLPVAMVVEVLGVNAAVATSFDTGTDELIKPSEVYTAQPLMTNNPVSATWIAGVDTLDTPTKGSPTVPVNWLCKTIQFTFQKAGTTFVEAAYVALGIDGRVLPELPMSSIQTHPVELFDGYGDGLTVSWARMEKEDAIYLSELWKSSEGGNWPIFFFPAPESKSSTGTLTSVKNSPAMRGGLMRILTAPTMTMAEEGAVWYATNVTLQLETWQESPSKKT